MNGEFRERNWVIVGVALFSTMPIVTTKVKKAKDDARKEIQKEKKI